MSLASIFLLICAGAVAAWFWHAHGVRERAVRVVKKHCERHDLQLLDDTVALQGMKWLPDAKGRRRLARVYAFEFTVTGEQRHHGSIRMFGVYPGGIQLDPYPCPRGAEERGARHEQTTEAPHASQGQVIDLDQWKRERSR
ncbi:MAG TPA: DUF3301 domain-containing protein [Pseudomonas sp.]|nr:DUF3301 domain-containing protein [Pseudomonas sp.]